MQASVARIKLKNTMQLFQNNVTGKDSVLFGLTQFSDLSPQEFKGTTSIFYAVFCNVRELCFVCTKQKLCLDCLLSFTNYGYI